jgi:TPR repeat protein
VTTHRPSTGIASQRRRTIRKLQAIWEQCISRAAPSSGDLARAFQLFLKATEQGYAVAQNNLAIMYANGQAVARDYVWAYAWLDVASRQVPEYSELRDRIAKEMRPDEVARGQDLAARKRAELSRKGALSK